MERIIKKRHFERLEKGEPFENGDAGLVYEDEIDYQEFVDDIKKCLGKDKSQIVLMIADESVSDEEEETLILARGQEAIDDFYDSCYDALEEKLREGIEDDSVAIFLKDAMEITNFYYKLCKLDKQESVRHSRNLRRVIESRRLRRR